MLFNIPVSSSYRKKSARLLLCYDNGRVNVLNPRDVIEMRLLKNGRRYSGGFDASGEATLLAAFVCRAEDYLVIRSRKQDGREMLKAVCIEPCKVRNPQSMSGRGVTFVRPELARTVALHLVPAEHNSFIYKIIARSDKCGPGHAADSSVCADARAYLAHRARMS